MKLLKVTLGILFYSNYLMAQTVSKVLPSDKQSTTETIRLFKNLFARQEKGVMFGHQDDLAYGVGWKYVNGRSDVKDVAGDYPALYGWELGNIEHDLPEDLDGVPFDAMRTFIRQGFERGGVITISWHADNPLNDQSAWDTTKGSVASILPGGSRHELYKSWLDRVAAFLGSLTSKQGFLIPVLLRPFHELTGTWFWWCRNTCSPTEFKLLWRFTADYLRHVKDLHHLLLVYNTADFTTAEEFLERYPGDDVVDVLSFDTYQYSNQRNDSAFIHMIDNRLKIVEALAKNKNKIAAWAETGLESIPDPNWWTNVLWKAIGDHKISYVLVWRNHGRQQNGHMHYYAPYKGDVSAENFKKFYGLDKTLFESDVRRMRLYEEHRQ